MKGIWAALIGHQKGFKLRPTDTLCMFGWFTLGMVYTIQSDFNGIRAIAGVAKSLKNSLINQTIGVRDRSLLITWGWVGKLEGSQFFRVLSQGGHFFQGITGGSLFFRVLVFGVHTSYFAILFCAFGAIIS